MESASTVGFSGVRPNGLGLIVPPEPPQTLEFLHELVPAVGLIAVLVNPAAPANTEAQVGEFQVAAGVFGVR
jgi:hypothetical protein